AAAPFGLASWVTQLATSAVTSPESHAVRWAIRMIWLIAAGVSARATVGSCGSSIGLRSLSSVARRRPLVIWRISCAVSWGSRRAAHGIELTCGEVELLAPAVDVCVDDDCCQRLGALQRVVERVGSAGLQDLRGVAVGGQEYGGRHAGVRCQDLVGPENGFVA